MKISSLIVVYAIPGVAHGQLDSGLFDDVLRQASTLMESIMAVNQAGTNQVVTTQVETNQTSTYEVYTNETGTRELQLLSGLASFLLSPLTNLLSININDPVYPDTNYLVPNYNTWLLAKIGTKFNTGARETTLQNQQRLANQVPEQNIYQEFEPLDRYGVCFNEEYYTNFAAIDQWAMYLDYVKLFEWGFANNMGWPLQSWSSSAQPGVSITNNRIASMMLRMCFHDNAINPQMPHFQDYIRGFIQTDNYGRKRWTGPAQFLETSGADASVLVCSQERFHPNQNYDQTASRVLFALQSKSIPGLVDRFGQQTSMVEKYGLSYADLLHNGGLAAAIFLRPYINTKWWTDVWPILSQTPMKFGRRDACRFQWETHEKVALCGPTELLPGLTLTTKQSNDWFVTRGMNPCQFMALMWTHTALDNVADYTGNSCPLKKLPCYNNFKSLDYFTYFLQPGTHQVYSTSQIEADPEAPNCDWIPVPRTCSFFGLLCSGGGKEKWPLTAIDCTISADATSKAAANYPGDYNLQVLKDVVKYFHTKVWPPEKVLLCSLRILGGKGDKYDCGDTGGTCTAIGTNYIPGDHMFGGFYGY